MVNFYPKLKNLVILLVCFIKFIFSGKANKKITNPNKILIIQMAKLGDMVCATPMFRAVRLKYPNSKIYVVGNKINKEVLNYNSDINKYIIYQNNFFKTIQILRNEKINFACITSPSFIFLAILYLSNIPLISVPIDKTL